MKNVTVLFRMVLGLALIGTISSSIAVQEKIKGFSRLAIIWSTADAEVANRLCFPYAGNAKKQGWFEEVTVIVWGPSARLLAGDTELQAKVKALVKDGVKVEACLSCADFYGVSDKLRGLGIEVKLMGKPLSDMLQNDWKVLTF